MYLSWGLDFYGSTTVFLGCWSPRCTIPFWLCLLECRCNNSWAWWFGFWLSGISRGFWSLRAESRFLHFVRNDDGSVKRTNLSHFEWREVMISPLRSKWHGSVEMTIRASKGTDLSHFESREVSTSGVEKSHGSPCLKPIRLRLCWFSCCCFCFIKASNNLPTSLKRRWVLFSSFWGQRQGLQSFGRVGAGRQKLLWSIRSFLWPFRFLRHWPIVVHRIL